MRQDFFTNPGSDVASIVEPVAAGLEKMAGVLPASLQADTDSYYAVAQGLSVDETQKALLKRTSFVLVLARQVGWVDHKLEPDVLTAVHNGIFQPVFGDRTLGFRTPPGRQELRDDDGVEYPTWIVTGAGRSPEIVTRRGIRSKQIVRRLNEACASFEASVPGATQNLDAGALAIARLYVRIIRVHPFGDGNGRTAWGIVQYAAGRLRLPFVQSAPTTQARLALGNAIRNGQQVQRLADEIKRATWPEA